ncbi:PREDICTED: pentatricopeptide repeat-containing [Prunus dulcis]|uniref:PREDICTED: pentatricopeptide repeat-containing n=1 Tax=Prunus dulcis TaxID=3755 RepID=A0A5E4GKT6_PRUDU|nr:hypothetical protein L3X38_024864 [Prunus dulcis]VVA40191.1 PREDICTED: pentatricopeptide repeat-containing [Prunus dulcis]
MMMRKLTAVISPHQTLQLFLRMPFSCTIKRDISSELFAVLSSPKWEKHPSLRKLMPSISPSHVSSLFALKLDPKIAIDFFYWIARTRRFKHSVHSHSSLLLNLLIPNGLLAEAQKFRILMIKACSSPADARFVLDLLLQLNRGGGPKNPEPLQFKLTLVIQPDSNFIV